MMAQHWMLAWYVMFQGIRTIIAKKPYIFVSFQGGTRPHASPLWIRAWVLNETVNSNQNPAYIDV